MACYTAFDSNRWNQMLQDVVKCVVGAAFGTDGVDSVADSHLSVEDVLSDDRAAWENGKACRNQGLQATLLRHRERVCFPPKGHFESHTLDNQAWGVLWQHLGSASSQAAMANLGFAMSEGKLFVLSTRYESPANEWSTMVKAKEERDSGCCCFNPNKNNVNFVAGQHDKESRDGRWLLVFMWVCKAAKFSGGHMIQLVIPSLGLSPMQLAEEQLAKLMGLRVERRDMDPSTLSVLSALKVPDICESLMDHADKKKTADLMNLIDNLDPPDSKLCEAALEELLIASLESTGQRILIDNEVLPPLIDVIQSGTDRSREQAARVLVYLITGDDKRKDMASEAGAIPAVVQLLCTGTLLGKHQAAVALGQLVPVEQGTDEICKRIARAGGIRPLLQLLQNVAPNMSDFAVDMHGDALPLPPASKASVSVLPIEEPGFAGPSSHGALPNGEPVPRKGFSAIGSLSHVAAFSEDAALDSGYTLSASRAADAKRTPMGITKDQVVAEKTAALKDQVVAEATAALRELARGPPDVKTQIVAEDAVGVLVELLRAGASDAKPAAARTLAILAEDSNEIRRAIVAKRGIEPSVQLLQDGTAKAKEAAACVLKSLARGSHDVKASIVTAGGIKGLEDMLRDGTSEAQGYAEDALIYLGSKRLQLKACLRNRRVAVLFGLFMSAVPSLIDGILIRQDIYHDQRNVLTNALSMLALTLLACFIILMKERRQVLLRGLLPEDPWMRGLTWCVIMAPASLGIANIYVQREEDIREFLNFCIVDILISFFLVFSWYAIPPWCSAVLRQARDGEQAGGARNDTRPGHQIAVESGSSGVNQTSGQAAEVAEGIELSELAQGRHKQ